MTEELTDKTKMWILSISPSVHIRIKKPNIILRIFSKIIGWRIEPVYEYGCWSLMVEEWEKAR